VLLAPAESHLVAIRTLDPIPDRPKTGPVAHLGNHRELVLCHAAKVGHSGFSVHNFLHFSSTFFRPGEWSLGTVSAPCKYHANHLGGGGGGGGWHPPPIQFYLILYIS